jgi:hypothetical protein
LHALVGLTMHKKQCETVVFKEALEEPCLFR